MYERIDREEVLAVIKRHGPLIPLEVRKQLGKGESTMIGAVLSELAYHKQVAISRVKRGGSPFYYDPNNPASLEKIAQHLGEKDKRTYDILQEVKVVDPDEMEPITRVGLDQIKDYSKPFEHNNKTYYRYFLTSEEEAKQLLEGKKTKQETPQQNTQQQTIQHDTKPEPQQQTSSYNNKQESNTVQAKKQAEQTTASRQENNNEQKPTPPKKTIQKQPTLQQPKIEDDFYYKIQEYCKEKNIHIQQAELIRKNSELDLILRVPSAIGRLTYYCKAKSKKKSNDGDIASALLSGQTKRLPSLYITTGDVTKKAKEMTRKELRGVVIKEI